MTTVGQVSTLLLIISFLAGSLKAQSTSGWERYTTAWVVRSTQYGGKPTSLTLLPKSLKRPKSGVRLVIPKKNMLVQHDNESRYIKMYLINSSSDTILVDRADATVIGISTEVFADGEWKIFQTITGSSCGNSYWKMTMQPKNFLYIELENKTKGPLKALYRVRLKTANLDVISNATTIYLTPELLRLAGTTPPAISL